MKPVFHLLVVDDSSANRFTLKSLLAREKQYVILEADSGLKALAMTIEHPIDLILLDVQMPGMDGYETARHLKMSVGTRDIPIIFITAVYKSQDFARRGYSVGAVDYLTKPIDDNLLLNRIRLYTNLFEREQALRQTLEDLQRKDRELQNANELLKQQLRERTVALNRSSDAIVSADEQGHVIFWNRGAAETFGYDESEILGQPLTRIMPEKYHRDHLNGIKEVIKKGRLKLAGKVVELSGLRKDGEVFPLEVSLAFWDSDGRRFFSAVIRDVSERKKMERDLRQAKNEAEMANRAKSAFLATMSHEIRTPMNAILGMGELLGETRLTETQAWYVKALNRSGETLLTLINDILDLSKIEADQLTLESKRFDLPQLIREVVELFTFTALNKEITLKHEVADGVPGRVLGDPNRLRQILINLIGNAVKFTTSGGITVTVAPAANDRVVFKVADTGPGIPLEKQAEIFHPFTQADSSITRKHGGTGLGLTICRKLADLMAGEIDLQSRPGQGTVFTFTAALTEDRSQPPAAKGDDAAAPPPPPLVNNRSLDILLVEDTEENQMVIKAYLRGITRRLQVAANGREALDLFKKNRFDLVLMDIQMPIMDGYEATEKMRAWERETNTPATPIIALTAHALTEDFEKIMAAGCNHHLAKPVRKKRLLSTIGRVVDEKGE